MRPGAEVIPFRPRGDAGAWLDKRQAASALGCSVRFLEYRVADGMPSQMRFGRRCFRLSAVEGWLTAHGYLEEAP